MERTDIQKIIEAVLFVAEAPVTLKNLFDLFEQQVTKEEITDILQALAADCQAREGALEVKEIAGGWQLATQSSFGPWIRKLFKDKLTYRLSPSAMETLSIVAYKQPVTRNEIEEIRGVEVSAVLDTLVERRLVKIAGRKEVIGRPMLYATTPDFLRAFGLRNLEDLPSIESLTPPPATEETPVVVDAAVVVEETPVPVGVAVVVEETVVETSEPASQEPTSEENHNA